MLLSGDNLEHLKQMDENSVDSVVTDPPYGLKFMNKKWDHQVPSVEFWREVYRVLKPGGHVLSFGGTRTYHRMAVNIEDAGFEIRDQIMWLYGSGFPKSYNIKKGIDKKGIDGSAHDGFGTALKPANEPIVLARKPLSEKTIVDNVLKYGTGGLNIDGCRVEAGNEITERKSKGGNKNKSNAMNDLKEVIYEGNPQGRFPANIILDEEAGQVLDEQSGILKTGGAGTSGQKIDGVATSFGGTRKPRTTAGDKGGASRFFYCAKASKSERNAGLDGMGKRIASTYEGNIDHKHGNRKLGARPDKPTQLQQNHHPTVKPIKLMEYLVRLVTPPGGTVLDPFMGSGTTGIACKNENLNFIGMELDSEYFNIAKQRITHHDRRTENTSQTTACSSASLTSLNQ